MSLNRNINDDSTLAYLFNKTRQGASDALQKAIDTINATIASIQTALNGKVSKSGDTMTGGLILKQTNIEVGDVPGTQKSMSLSGLDKNNTSLGWVSYGLEADGNVFSQIGAQRVVNGSTLYNMLRLRIKSDGTRYITLSEAAPWLSALGLNLTSTTTASSIVTAASGFSVDSAEYKQWGKVAMINIVFKKTTAVTSATSMSPGTIVSGKRPATISCVVSSDPTLSPGTITTGGVINTYGTWAANGTKRIMATYLLP